eukprot:EC121681.1.p1 GENE.EC121681.1~~EC121681.1.p1  ORF type:complete len:107 (+),score=11.18 EC121681.1:92-412(+)
MPVRGPVAIFNDCPTKVVTGFFFGGMVGTSFGILFGTFEAVRYRMGFVDGLKFVGRSSAASAIGFAVFMGVGSAIRCEGRQPEEKLRQYPYWQQREQNLAAQDGSR